MPKFEYTKIDKSPFSNDNLKKPTLKKIIIYSSTGCDDCKLIVNNYDLLKKYHENLKYCMIILNKKTCSN